MPLEGLGECLLGGVGEWGKVPDGGGGEDTGQWSDRPGKGDEATSSGVAYTPVSCLTSRPGFMQGVCVCVFVCMQREACGGLGEPRQPGRFGEQQAIWGHL